MATNRSPVSDALIERVAQWLERSALEGAELKAIVSGTCERLTAAGVPLTRVHIGLSMLHPLYDALGFTWNRGKGLSVEGFDHRASDEKPDRFLNSPYYYLLSNNLESLRRRIAPASPSEFPVFEDLKALGITDYLAYVQSFGDTPGRGMLGSWATDAADGFDDGIIEALLHIQRKLAVTMKMAVLGKLSNNLLSTYLGESAGERVLAGQTRRGDADTIRAVLVMADMRNSTALAEKTGRQGYIEALNQFFEAIAAPFNGDGGEILSFIGDGFLAVYPCERHAEPSQIAARAALAAAHLAGARVTEMNKTRERDGLEPIGYGIGLHVGNVMFGNVGLKNRLTFSAFGSAVNEVQRLESLTKDYKQPIVASEQFVEYGGGEWVLGGRQKLRGLGEEVSVFLPKRTVLENEPVILADWSAERRSEAEEVMMLYRQGLAAKGTSQSSSVS